MPMETARMLLEREPELYLLAGLLDDVGSAGGKVVLVRGEAGIGKTALVREFLGRVADRAHILFGSCDDLLTARPLGPFWDMARQEPSLRDPLERGDRSGVLEATLDLLERSLRPTVFLIEDTQWADEATLDVVRYLGRRIASTHGLLLLTYRDSDVDLDHPLRGVIGDLPPDSVRRIRLRGLSLAAVSSLIANSSLVAEEVFAATDGNPFLVTEMASVEREVVPPSVQDSVMARVLKLSPGAQETLRILSVVPERVSKDEMVRFAGGPDGELDECQRRGLLDVGDESIAFHHELIRRAVEASLTTSERVAMNRLVLETLSPDTDPARLVHHARQANDVDRLVEFAPKAARAALAVGSHRESVGHFRRLTPYVDRLDTDVRGPILEGWALEEQVADNYDRAMDVSGLALAHYRELGDQGGMSRALVAIAYCHEVAGRRSKAEEFAQRAVEILGSDPVNVDLARALDVNAYLAAMAFDVDGARELVERTLAVAGPDIDEKTLIRCLMDRGCADNIAGYPDGWPSLDEARRRAAAAGYWWEEVRALHNHADMALEVRDLGTAAEFAEQAMASIVRHEVSWRYAEAVYARVLELQGRWDEAQDLALGVLDDTEVVRRVAVPVLGVIDARRGRTVSRETLTQAWEAAVVSSEFQSQGPTAAAVAEHAWISGDTDIPVSEIRGVMEIGLDIGFLWTSGSIAFWLWKLGELAEVPKGIAEPYRLPIEGRPLAAAEVWAERGIPNERAIALSHGDNTARLEALDILDDLGATAVTDKLRQELRDQG
ncbi:MAG: AAA family ATPase, partial [Actinomycetota bacterium]|nr:AAA family ATPase [Actinomycetota bacterium]